MPARCSIRTRASRHLSCYLLSRARAATLFLEGGRMSMNFSTAAQRALSDTWSKLIEGGTGDAWLEFYDRKMPKNPDDPVTTQRLLARLHVEPQTMRAEPANAIA